MWEARVGMEVICIEDPSKYRTNFDMRNYTEIYPVFGNKYTIREIVKSDFKGTPCFYLEEIVNTPQLYETFGVTRLVEISFGFEFFKPVTKTNIDQLIELTINPTHRLNFEDTPNWDRKRKINTNA